KDMGVNGVLLLPVNEFHGRHSWGYNPSDLFAVESAYGGPDALKEFVKACHERGIAVHLDIVHNHYGPQDLSLVRFDGSGGGENKNGIYFY
ncbi:1,4-alpha-glucan branching protein, partial [bacterium]|nr:1,4-alpha-glucan branching protein [bacterium]